MNAPTTTAITVRVPLTVRSRPGRKTVVTAGGGHAITRADPAVLKALARAFRWKRMLEEGRHASISEIAEAETLDRSYVGTVLRLTLLAPDLVQGLMDGKQPPDRTLPRLLEPWPVEWEGQRAEFMAAAAANSAGPAVAGVGSGVG